MIYSSLRIAVFTVAMLLGCVLGAQKPRRAIGGRVLPPKSYLSLLGQDYAITVVSDGPYEVTMRDAVPRIHATAATTHCPTLGDYAGNIKISSSLTQHEQAKALLQEVIRVADECSLVNGSNEEKVAAAIADLMASSLGGFVLEGLTR
jgi:hypothetical protein